MIDELLAELIDRGWELHYLRGPPWEAYVVSRYDQDRVRCVAHANGHSAEAALETAMAHLESSPIRDVFEPDLGAIDHTSPFSIPLPKAKPLGITRRF